MNQTFRCDAGAALPDLRGAQAARPAGAIFESPTAVRRKFTISIRSAGLWKP